MDLEQFQLMAMASQNQEQSPLAQFLPPQPKTEQQEYATIQQPPTENESLFPNMSLSSEEQADVVAICTQFKQQVNSALRLKKEKQRTSYAYYKGEFIENDGLPVPHIDGTPAAKRTRLFLPVSKQIAIQLYSGVYLSLMPDDEGYFSLRSRSGNYAEYEDGLTKALEYKLKQANFRADFGSNILNKIIFGYSACTPTMCADTIEEWEWSEIGKEYKLKTEKQPAYPKLQLMNPIQFSIDPSMEYSNKSKWVYMDNKKRQELLDASFYFNKDKIKGFDTKEARKSDKQGQYPDLNAFADMISGFTDVEPNLRYDLYFIPHMKLSSTGREFRNFLCGVVEEQTLVRFQPNPFPRGLNPVCFGSWRPDPQTPMGDGPMDDIQEIQKLINIYENYKIDVMAKIGNTFVARHGTDFTQAFGQTCSIIYTENPQTDVIALTGNMNEIAMLQNSLGVLKAEAQVLAGSNQPFQGSSNIDFKKTATEMKITQENSITIAREVIEHIASDLKNVLERFCWMLADEYTEPIKIRMDEEDGDGIQEVDFSQFKSGDFEIEITTVNPNQSREAQADMLKQIVAMIPPEEMARMVKPYPAVKKLGDTMGLRSLQEIIKTPNELQQELLNMQPPQPPMADTAMPPAV